MTARLTVATLLERAAWSLRRMPIDSAVRQARPSQDSATHPTGRWRCIHSDEMFMFRFAVGGIYPCGREEGTAAAPAGTAS